MSRSFIDRLRIFVKAGSGAAGNPTIRGKGGNGGSIYLEVKEGATLDAILKLSPTKRFKAGHGLEASKRRGLVLGRDGEDVIIPVPPGISVYTAAQGKSTPVMLGDLDRPEQRLLVAQGGMGGIPQTGYLGTCGQATSIVLDLKLMADYSFIGLPNAGKSSLLKALSNANVKIASYPFTTIRPQIAHCKYEDGRMISLADLPGLADIYATYTGNSDDSVAHTEDDASSDSAAHLPPLRHTHFLKHVERSSCLLMALDSNGFQRDQTSPWRSPLACAYLLLHLLERWSDGYLLEKPIVCLLNKIDLPDARKVAERSLKWLENLRSDEAMSNSDLPSALLPKYIPTFANIRLVSAAKGTNIPALKLYLRQHLDEIELHKRAHHLERLAEEEDAVAEKFLFDRTTNYC